MKLPTNSAKPYWSYADKPEAELRQAFMSLLDEDRPEQTYQTYIERNTRLVPREFVQNHGIHFKLVLRKLSFGADYKSDFAYLSKSSDDWNCVLVEIERPGARFFRGTTNEFDRSFNRALEQIHAWRAWFLESANKTYFADSTVGLIRTPLEHNPINPKFVLVYGRRSEYASNPIRRRLIATRESDDIKIMTFDSLAEDLRSKHDLYVGSKHNDFIDIISEVFLDESMFACMQPEQIRITANMRDSARAARDQWCHIRRLGSFAMTDALASVRYVPGSNP